MAHGRKKAPAGYRWKTVTIPGSRPKSFTTKHVLVPLDSMEAKFKEAEQESYKAFTPYPGQAVDPDVDRTPLPETQDQVWAGINPNLADSVESIKAGEKERAKFKDTWGANKYAMGATGATDAAYRELGARGRYNPFTNVDALEADTPFFDLAAFSPIGKAAGISAAGVKIVADAARKRGLLKVIGDASKTVAGTKALTKVKGLVHDAQVTAEGKAAVNKGSKNLSRRDPESWLGAKSDLRRYGKGGVEDEYVPGLDVADIPKFTPRRVQTTAPVVKNLTGESKVIADGTIPPASTLPRNLIDDMPPPSSGSRVASTGDAAAAQRWEAQRARQAAADRARAETGATSEAAAANAQKILESKRAYTQLQLAKELEKVAAAKAAQKVTSDSSAKAMAARKASKTKQLTGLALATGATAGYLYDADKEKNAAILAAEQAEKAKEPVGGSGYQHWDKEVQDAVQPDLDYARQASGALPRSNNIGGKPATEEQMSWAEKYYGAKFARDPAARYKKNKEFKQSLWKKMAILNAIAALTGNTSQAEQYATYALGMHEDATQFDDDMRMHKMHKAVYFRPDGTFDPPKNNEQAYNRAIQIGASPDEAKEVYGFTPKKTAKQMFWRPGADNKPEIKYFDKGVQPEDDGKGIWRTDAVDDPTPPTLSAIGKRIAERDSLVALKEAAIASGDNAKAEVYERHISAYDRDFDPNSSPSVRATRIWNVYKDLHKGMGGNLKDERSRDSFERWIRDQGEGGGAMWARMHDLTAEEMISNISSVPVAEFNSREEARAAADRGEIQSGDTIAITINGKRIVAPI